MSRKITKTEADKLGNLAWFVRGEDGLIWFTNCPAR
jgi:hypothetical protein